MYSANEIEEMIAEIEHFLEELDGPEKTEGEEGTATQLETKKTYENLSFGVTHGIDLATGAEAFQFNEDRFRHTMVLGRTGSGKSNHIQRMEREDIRNGAGVFVLAAHADDALWPLACLPEERLGDAILLDFSNPQRLPRLNPLDVDTSDQTAMAKAIEDVIELLKIGNHYSMAGPRFEKMARDGLRLIMDSPHMEDHCIANLARVYLEPDYVKGLLKYCTDRHTYDQWTMLIPDERRSTDSGELIHWFVSKVSRFASNRTLSHVFGPGHSTIDMREVVDKGKVFVAYVPESRLGKICAHTISKWLVMQLSNTIMSRKDVKEGLDYELYEKGGNEDKTSEPFFVYVDEFSKFASTDFEALIAESRKQSVGLVLSTQTLSQTTVLDYETGRTSGLAEAIVGNVGTFVCYPMGIADAEHLASQLDVPASDLMHIRRYQPLVRLMVGNSAMTPRKLMVDKRPTPDDPTMPRRVADHMIDTGIWLQVDTEDDL